MANQDFIIFCMPGNNYSRLEGACLTYNLLPFLEIKVYHLCLCMFSENLKLIKTLIIKVSKSQAHNYPVSLRGIKCVQDI